MTDASMYADFAEREARGLSPMYERLSLAISCGEEILTLLQMVPKPVRDAVETT